jgi:hypothetical protein
LRALQEKNTQLRAILFGSARITVLYRSCQRQAVAHEKARRNGGQEKLMRSLTIVFWLSHVVGVSFALHNVLFAYILYGQAEEVTSCRSNASQISDR